MNALGSAALREITVDGGLSFQGWWLTKIFVDEMLQWLASLGGFIDHVPTDPMLANGSGSNESRYSSIDGEFAGNSFTAINNAQDGEPKGVQEVGSKSTPYTPFS